MDFGKVLKCESFRARAKKVRGESLTKFSVKLDPQNKIKTRSRRQAEFKHILRTLSTNVEGKRKASFGLKGIKGIGRIFSFLICKKAKIDTQRRAGDLFEAKIQKVTEIIADSVGNGIPKWFLNKQKDFKDGTYSQLASNLLDTNLREDLERLKKTRSIRGLRHFWDLKVRGQHNKSTSRGSA